MIAPSTAALDRLVPKVGNVWVEPRGELPKLTPNTAVQKQNPDQETGGVSPGGAVGTGGPGATAKSGTQGGPAPTADPAQLPTERSAQDVEGRRAGCHMD